MLYIGIDTVLRDILFGAIIFPKLLSSTLNAIPGSPGIPRRGPCGSMLEDTLSLGRLV